MICEEIVINGYVWEDVTNKTCTGRIASMSDVVRCGGNPVEVFKDRSSKIYNLGKTMPKKQVKKKPFVLKNLSDYVKEEQ